MKNIIQSIFDMLHADADQPWSLATLAERYFAENPQTQAL
jgi:hypothetical protein